MNATAPEKSRGRRKSSHPVVDFKKIKQTVSIMQVLEHYGLVATLTPKGEGLSGPCPLCQGTNPTQFRVNPGMNAFYCFGDCKKADKSGGTILDFVMQKEGVAIRDAGLLLMQWFGLDGKGQTATPAPVEILVKNSLEEPQEGLQEGKTELPTANPVLTFQSLKTLDFGHTHLIEERGFAVETLEYFGVGYCTKGMHQGRIAIPIHNAQGGLVAYAGAPLSGGGYIYPAGFRKELELFNLHRARADPRRAEDGIIIVSDCFAVLRLYEAGYGQTVALMGESLSREQWLLLVEAIKPKAKVTLLFETGSKGAVEILSKLIGTFFVRLVRSAEAHTPIADLSQGDIQHLLA